MASRTRVGCAEAEGRVPRAVQGDARNGATRGWVGLRRYQHPNHCCCKLLYQEATQRRQNSWGKRRRKKGEIKKHPQATQPTAWPRYGLCDGFVIPFGRPALRVKCVARPWTKAPLCHWLDGRWSALGETELRASLPPVYVRTWMSAIVRQYITGLPVGVCSATRRALMGTWSSSTVAAPIPGEDLLPSSEPLDTPYCKGWARELEGRKGKEGKGRRRGGLAGIRRPVTDSRPTNGQVEQGGTLGTGVTRKLADGGAETINRCSRWNLGQ
ncbi:hypothetical protein EDB87DRAFT_1580798 [Lactarius vividus]|nr:hypothetical protein EDB87DRAFT_1580798 [Lactarius vividus]